MIARGDTTSIAVRDWAHNQAAYVDKFELILLLVLTHHAFYRTDNPEDAPVGQVLQAYSGLDVLAAWTCLSPRQVRRALWSLQCEHGYLTRTPRPLDHVPGRLSRVIRVFWSEDFDALRAGHRAGAPLPDEFVVSARQIETRDRKPDLRLIRIEDEVEQVQPNWPGGPD